jgi:Putative zinc-finger
MSAQENHVSLDGSIRRVLSAGMPSAEPCPSSDVFAAYFEHSLDPEETERYDSHLAGCPSCRAILAGVARASQTATPALESKVESQRHWNALRFWLATAAASVVALFVVMIVYQRTTKTSTENAQLAMSRAVANPAPAESDSRKMAAPAPEPKLETALPPVSAQPPPMPVPQSVRTPKPLPPPQSQALELSTRAKASAPATALEKSSPASEPNEGASADAASVAQVAPSAAPPVQSGANSSNKALTMRAQAAAPSGLMSKAKKAQAPAKDLVITSPDSQITWTIHTNHVQYSENGQNAPVQDFLPTNSSIAAGSSPGGKVCWLVGADGAVVLTTDGRLWLGTASPSTSDLTGIQATSAKAATVSSANGHTYVTADGGQTWKSQN